MDSTTATNTDENPSLTEHLLQISDENASTLPKIRVQSLYRFTDTGTEILKGVTLDIPAGAAMGIIGPSGSGKSTLLRALNRLWEPAANTVFLNGEDVTELDVISVRRRVGMLFQTPVLFDGLDEHAHSTPDRDDTELGTVADNIMYGPNLQGKKLKDSEMEELLKLADLDPSFLNRSVVGLSVGQAQRVALARTLANDPEVLLLDEPTSALDPISTQNIEDTIMKLRKVKGLTIVLVSHSIKQVNRITDTVCFLVNGEIVEVLSQEELASSRHPLIQQFLEAS